MPERGGPTAQSGILYQNSIAALYLGRLCDTNERLSADQVVRVRVEAPESVDDTVVSFADGHTAYVQAKERVDVGDAAWQKLWRDFAAQYQRSTFARTRDQLRLHVGEPRDEHVALRELADRARASENAAEWFGRLSQDQRSIFRSVAAAVAMTLPGSDEVLHALLAHVDVETWPLVHVQRDLVPVWMPAASISSHTLFRLLRDRVGGKARVRGTFTAAELQESLRAENRVELRAAPSVEALREAVAACGALLRQHKNTLGGTGRHVTRAVITEVVAWAQAPEADRSVGLLLDHAGRGKTVVMREVLLALEAAGVPVLAVKADQQLSGIESAADLQRRLELTERAEIVVARLAAGGRVVVLIDQIDALSLALARDQRAMNVVLELVGRLRAIPTVTVLLSCRTFDRHTDPRLKRIEVGREFTVPLLDESEVAPVLASLGVSVESLTPATRELLRTPLHLDLYASLARTPGLAPDRLRGIASLQGLYGVLWEDVVRRPEPLGPAAAEREAVLRRITARMHQDQHTTVPPSAVDVLGSPAAAQAANWLASAGVLVASTNAWTFLHQTFFDYCYARFFVEAGERLHDAVLASDQGLFIRPQVVQVLAYLRGTGHPEYLRTLGRLLDGTGLRFHLHDLVLRWFGALQDPNDAEWMLLHRRLFIPTLRDRILRAIRGNPVWFAKVEAGLLPRMLDDEGSAVDDHVLPYLASLVDSAETQAGIATLACAWLKREEPWPARAHWLAQLIRAWRTPEAIALYEQVLELVAVPNLRHAFQLDDVAQADPAAGARILRRVFDRVLDTSEAEPGRTRSAVAGLRDALNTVDGHAIKQALGAVSAVAPAVFLDAMLPWIERATAGDRPHDGEPTAPWYESDALTELWAGRSGVRGALLDALASALCGLWAADPDAFRERAVRLAAIASSTPQELLARVYRDTMPGTVRDALHFVISDSRRLRLGRDDALLTRQLLKALVLQLDAADLAAVEQLILTTTGKVRPWDKSIAALRWRGIDQLHLLRALPRDRLSPAGRDRLGELERKLPNIDTPEHPSRDRGGVIGPPIPADVLRRMPVSGWLGAMAKYPRRVRDAKSRRSGSRELAHQLQALVKENPQRFAELAARTPPDLDDDYAEAFIVGLAESDCSAEWVYGVVRRFSTSERWRVHRRTTWALERALQRSACLPQDILALLEGWVRSARREDEAHYDTSEQDLWHAAINTDRGTAFIALLTALRKDASDEAIQRRWALLEFAAQDPSPVLRSAGLSELTYMLDIDRDRSVALFEEMVRDQPRLRSAHPFQEFLYWASYGHFATLGPYVRELMHADDVKVRQRGAELAVLAHLAPRSLENAAAVRLAEELVREVLSGPAEWRRGAAQIYAHNLADYPGDRCEEGLRRLFDDPDVEVRREVAWMTHRLRTEDVFRRADFLSAFARSWSAQSAFYDFAEYLWEHGPMNPAWATSTVDALLANPHPDNDRNGLVGAEHLVRAVLRVYTDPTADKSVRGQTMDVFDHLMERFSGPANEALVEWDRG